MVERRSLAVVLRGAVVLAVALTAGLAAGAEYRVTADAPAILYDAPSTKAKPLFVYGRDVPVEVLVNVEGWTKIRDAGGSIGWMTSKALTDKRVLLVRVPIADVRANPDEASPIVLRAEHNVLLELAESASSPGTTAAPGWVKVRHRDGQTGYVRLPQIFGF